MEEQNRMVTQSLTSTETEPLPTTPVPEQTVADSDNNAVPEVMPAGGVDSGGDSVAGTESEAVVSEQGARKRRGRPRKYDGNGNLLVLSPISAPPGFSTYPFDEGSSSKRSRGRPRGSGKLQLLASLGGYLAETAGGSFTPYVLFVSTGEDVVSRISSFSHRGSRAAMILCATGAVSSVTIRQSGSSAGVLRYEGRFEIVSLTGSCTYGGFGGAHRKRSMLTVTLAKPDGMIFGGGVGGSLIAASPIQLIVASFKQNISKQIKRRHTYGSSAAPNMAANPHSARVPQKDLKIIEGQQSCPSPTSGLVNPATTNVVPDNIVTPATTTTNGAPENLIHVTTTNGVLANLIPAAINAVSDNVIPADHNMNSASVNVDVMQPITDQKTSADDNINVPQV